LTWRTVDAALRRGGRGLPAGESLRQLLSRLRGAANPRVRRVKPQRRAEIVRLRDEERLSFAAIGQCLGMGRQRVEFLYRAAVLAAARSGKEKIA
jgi:hypothetical protein